MFREYFSRFGPIARVKFGKSKNNNEPLGYAFVDFKESSAVEGVLAQKHFLMGREVRVCLTQLDVKSYKCDADVEIEKADCLQRKVHVRGLPQGCDKQLLRETLSQFGKVSKSFVLYNHLDGSTRGFGFVEFEDTASAMVAVKAGRVLVGTKEILICKAVSKEESDGTVDDGSHTICKKSSRTKNTTNKQSPGRQHQAQTQQRTRAGQPKGEKPSLRLRRDTRPSNDDIGIPSPKVLSSAKLEHECTLSSPSSEIKPPSIKEYPIRSFHQSLCCVAACLEKRWRDSSLLRFNHPHRAYNFNSSIFV